ncbi:hypothetical protein BKI52_44460 [marine bacterium AO1-C]|nr:hypothetical protein BKI52_44460 [marine bacterium AO1-C]
MAAEYDNLLRSLDRACDGLLFMSESDYPFESFYWDHKGELSPEKVIELAHEMEDARVKELTLETFFKNAVAEESWYDTDEVRTARRFQNLVDTLKRNLEEIKVYRVGFAEAEVYIVGKPEFGGYAGVSTHVVQT